MLDANVLVAAYLTEGLCARLLRRARQGQFELFTCAQILAETRDNLQKLTSPSTEALDAVMAHLLAVCTVIKAIPPLGRRVCRDATDDGILACARAARVDYLVTGDRDLLALRTFDDIPVISPRSFESLFTE
ncbi:MAG: putative toxin-antitoxin system toxin component, PIN family [Zetaproteobacteria bacterium]|nr:MAG: putative toxin-antitoxin system toxin component, PIN family [Zetaproteobacteria bacterium]